MSSLGFGRFAVAAGVQSFKQRRLPRIQQIDVILGFKVGLTFRIGWR